MAKKNKKLAYIILGIAAVIIILAIFGYFKITGSPTVAAFLNIYKGNVQVDHGKGWAAAQDGMKLTELDHVKTMQDSEAAVVLHESVIVNMAPDTELFIKDLTKKHIKVEQPSGSTWNKFTGIAGVEDYSVETPTTVATVRGTGFEVNMNSILVGEGEVEVEYNGEKYVVKLGKKAVIRDGQLVIEDLTEEDWARIRKEGLQTIEAWKILRMKEVEKHPILARQLKKTYMVTDEEIQARLEQADRGEYDLDELAKKSPVQMESVYKIKAFTEEIIKENKKLENK